MKKKNAGRTRIASKSVASRCEREATKAEKKTLSVQTDTPEDAQKWALWIHL